MIARNVRRVRRILTEDFVIYLKAKGKKPLRTQASEIWDLYRHYRYIPYQYLKNSLYLRQPARDIYRYIPPELLHITRDRANSAGDLSTVDDKLVFERTLRAAGLTTTRTLFLLKRDGIRDLDGTPVRFETFIGTIEDARLPEGILIKPTGGGSGSAVFKFHAVDGRLLHAGKPMSEDAFMTLIFTTNGGFHWTDFIIQETIVQHAEIARLNPTSVNTIRIDTFVDDADTVFFNAAAIKVGAPGSITDNYGSGGYMIPIDLETGRLSRRAKVDAPFGGHTQDTRTLFDIDLSTFAIPFWPDLRHQAIRAAQAIRPLRAVGWDIAITPGGPLTVEANADYGIDALQELSGGYADKPLGLACIQSRQRHG